MPGQDRILARDRGPQIKDDKLYEDLLARGDWKEKAARIANAEAQGSLQHRSTRLEACSKADLMNEARRIGIEGRSTMSTAGLERTIRGHC